MAYARDDRPFGGNGPPMVGYRFEDIRRGEHVARHLAGFAGIQQVGGYAAYNRLANSTGASEGVTPAPCFSTSGGDSTGAHQREVAAGDVDRHDDG
ncbi:hypothetical protein AOQ73_39935 [Bradyrhizobium pachyrhizi]|nr:hypothetical protein AOQ73_39935 [Bradyrhizobium pachyrhizi]